MGGQPVFVLHAAGLRRAQGERGPTWAALGTLGHPGAPCLERGGSTLLPNCCSEEGGQRGGLPESLQMNLPDPKTRPLLLTHLSGTLQFNPRLSSISLNCNPTK